MPNVDPSPVFETPPTGLRHSLALAACNDGKVLAELLKQEKMRYFNQQSHARPSLAEFACFARKPEEVNKQVGDSGYTPLHYALLYVNVECVDSLVGVHAGEELLMHCPCTTNYLQHNYVDATIVDASGNCPIHFATEARNKMEFERIVNYLRCR